MGKKASPLTIISLRKKQGKHRVERSLYLNVRGESATWCFRYMLKGISHEIGLGSADVVDLANARHEVGKLRIQLHEGIDPLAERRKSTTSATFEAVAAELIESKRAAWRNAKHAQQWTNTLTQYAYPVLGKLHVKDIETEHVLKVLKPIWKEKHETATRLRQRIEAVLDAAAAKGLRDALNPARWKGHLDKLLSAIPKADRVQHHEAVPWQDMPAFMGELRQQEGIAALALEFIILTATRTSETLNAQWDEVNLDEGIWTIPKTRMKAKREHRVPLSLAAMEVLNKVPRIDGNPFIFPGRNDKPLSNMAAAMLLRRMSHEETTHGFRSSFRDWVSEATNFNPELSEMALAHTIGDETEAAYRRGDLMKKRQKLMQAWADYLGGLKKGADVIPIKRGAAK